MTVGAKSQKIGVRIKDGRAEGYVRLVTCLHGVNVFHRPSVQPVSSTRVHLLSWISPSVPHS